MWISMSILDEDDLPVKWHLLSVQNHTWDYSIFTDNVSIELSLAFYNVIVCMIYGNSSCRSMEYFNTIANNIPL